MCLEKKKLEKGPFNAKVVSNYRIGRCFHKIQLAFEGAGAEAFGETKAGQFAEVDLSTTSIPGKDTVPGELKLTYKRNILLRRPFSFSDVFRDGGKVVVEILYCVVGPSSLRMMNLKEDDTVSVIGPLGNGFGINENKNTALLIVGGMGAGPLIHLAKQLKNNNPEMKVLGFIGARSVGDLPYENFKENIGTCQGDWIMEFARSGVKTVVSTDDGTAGFKGFITECLGDHLKREEVKADDAVIYSCGPEVMLAKVAEIGLKYGIECQVSLERRMACGIGLCQGCAVECRKEGFDDTFYKMCCKDGPVFDSKEVVF